VPKEGATVKKPYSIASPPASDRTFELCIKRVEGGFVSTHFDQLRGGESFEFRGPLGRFRLKEPVETDLLFLATGTGVAPFRSMLHGLYPLESGTPGWPPYAYHGDRDVRLIFGVRHEDEILYEEEFRQMADRYPRFQFIPTISRPRHWEGETGYVQEHVARHCPQVSTTHVYVCGLLPMIEASRTVLKGMGFTREQIHYEIYT
jgi:NAD(P)H-flavin reductase